MEAGTQQEEYIVWINLVLAKFLIYHISPGCYFYYTAIITGVHNCIPDTPRN